MHPHLRIHRNVFVVDRLASGVTFTPRHLLHPVELVLRDDREMLILLSGPASESPRGKFTPISQLMDLAIHCDELLRTWQVARLAGVIWAYSAKADWLPQILTFLNLGPDM